MDMMEAGDTCPICYVSLTNENKITLTCLHFICEKCGNVYDVMSECSECGILKNKSASRRTKVGTINSYKINFYGICKNCRR